jgi:hypothetical protein
VSVWNQRVKSPAHEWIRASFSNPARGKTLVTSILIISYAFWVIGDTQKI